MDYSNIKKLLSDSLRDKVENEATDLNLLRGQKAGNKLPDMSTDPFASYAMYNALKLHFETDGYDAIKYNFKTSVKPTSFFKRKDKYFFAKLAKKHDRDLKDYYISNFKSWSELRR